MVRNALAKVILVGLVLCATAAPAFAVEEAPDIAARRAAAGRLADEGFDLISKNRCEEALDVFRRADETLHSPMFIVFMARAERCLGRLVEARAHLKGVVDEKLADYAPDSFWEAKRTAQKELDELQPHVPTWTLRVQGATLSQVSVRVDGNPIDAVALRSPQPINPGQHEVEAETLDGRSGKASFTATQGESVAVEVDLGAEEGDGPPPIEDPPDETPGWSSNPYLPGAIAYGVGGAGLIMGVITGAIFVGRAGDLKDKCPNDQCPPEEEEEGDAVSTLGTISTVGFIVAGVGAVAGTILVLTIPGDDSTASDDTAIRVGPGGVFVSGAF
ncbi:MAG: hypothetical protein JRI55_26220 [Deltaproteobacteria bacterium]|nr:hypothetical protein [Deltaproteobacteria bacterium]